jgi:exonuclease SbcD
LELDFGEAGEAKRVVIVDVEPGLPAVIRSVPLSAGRRLLRPRGTWEAIVDMDGLDESYLDLTVETTGPDPGLAERARDEFDYLVKVAAEYERPEREAIVREGRTLLDLYGAYHEERTGVAAADSLLDAFREVLEVVNDASP